MSKPRLSFLHPWLSLGAVALLLAAPTHAQTCMSPPAGLVVWWDADDVSWYPGLTPTPHALNSARRIDGLPLLLNGFNPSYPWPTHPQAGPNLVPGRFGGQAFRTDWINANVSMGMSATGGPQVDFTTGLSIELWLRGTDGEQYAWGQVFPIVEKNAAGGVLGDTGYALLLNRAGGTLTLRVGHGGGAVSTVTSTGHASLLDGAFHHVAATFDAADPSTNLRVYVDGQLCGAAPASPPPGQRAVAVHSGLLNVSKGLVGGPYTALVATLDEIRLYDRALTPSSIASLAQRPVCRPTFPAREFADQVVVPAHGTGWWGTDLDVDGDLLVVGRMQHAPYIDYAGVVDAYRRTGSGWTLLGPVGSPIPGKSGRASLDLDDHVLAYVADAGGAVINPTNQLRVHRFDGVSLWVSEVVVEPQPPARKSATAVAVFGNAIALGATGVPGPIPGIGHPATLDIFEWTGSAWVHQVQFMQSAFTWFGRSLAMGQELLLVGADRDPLDGANAGAVHVYRRSAGTWSHTQTIVPSQLEPGLPSYVNFGLGSAVAIDGTRAIVGAWGGPNGSISDQRGRAYVIDLTGGGLTVEGALVPSTAARGFANRDDGWDRAYSPKVDLEGDRAVVRAVYDTDTIVTYTGVLETAYVFHRTAGQWREVAKLIEPSPDFNGAKIDGCDVLALSAGIIPSTFPGTAVVRRFANYCHPFPHHELVGPGCPGTLGIPGAAIVAPPRIGGTTEVAFDRVPQNAALVAIGWSSTMAGALPLPFDLAGSGAPGCQWRVSVEAVVFLAGANQQVAYQLTLPLDPDLLGAPLHFQALVLDPPANSLGATTSDAVRILVGQ